jgi:hypothetical protein
MKGVWSIRDEQHMPEQERRYRLYIDESGDHTFSGDDTDRHRYLGLLGVWFEQNVYYPQFCDLLDNLKSTVFDPHPDDPPICLHRKDIVERRGIFGRLGNQELNRRFESLLLECVNQGKFRMTCVVLDKRSHETKTYRQFFHPYHYCLSALLERYAGWLEHVGAEGDVMAEARGKVEDRLLSEAFEATLTRGTRFHSAERFQQVLTSTKIKFKTKRDNIAGLQLADLLVYPFKREMILERREETLPCDFSARVLDAARERINRHRSRGQVLGMGRSGLYNKEAPEWEPFIASPYELSLLRRLPPHCR